VWIYRDKATGIPKGEATITYEDEQAASSAIDWFNSESTSSLYMACLVVIHLRLLCFDADWLTLSYLIELNLLLTGSTGIQNCQSNGQKLV